MSIGNKMPVEALAPNMKTNMATIMTLIPLIPDFDKPKMKAAEKRMTRSLKLGSIGLEFELNLVSF